MVSRYLSRPLERMLAGHGVTLTEFQLMVTLREGPARALELARRLRLDPAPTSRTLARLDARGIVRRTLPWRFAEWVLEPEGAMHLELLEPLWVELNLDLHRTLGPDTAATLIRLADRLPATVPREHQGWTD